MIGLDISDQAVKVVQLLGSERRFNGYGAAAVPSGAIRKGIVAKPSALGTAIESAFQRSRGINLHDAVVASIPEAQSFLRVVEIPEMSEDEISEAVQWEVAKHIPFGLDNVYIDWQLLAGGHTPAAGRQEVLVGAAQKNVVDPLLALLQSMKLDIAAFELESQAIVRALVSAELAVRSGLLIINVGESATNVVVHDHGAIRFTATVPRGALAARAVLPSSAGKLLAGEATALPKKDDEGLARLLTPFVEELVAEVHGIVEFYNSIDAQHEVQEIILTGGGSTLPGFDRVLLRSFEGVAVQQGNPWIKVFGGNAASTSLNKQDSARLATTVGLALRKAVTL